MLRRWSTDATSNEGAPYMRDEQFWFDLYKMIDASADVDPESRATARIRIKRWTG
jgi:hypothetical protein